MFSSYFISENKIMAFLMRLVCDVFSDEVNFLVGSPGKTLFLKLQ